MPLEFRGIALMDPPKRRVRFAGYSAADRSGRITICEVSVEALETLACKTDLSEPELMEVFELHKDVIFAEASALFDAGHSTPHVRADKVVSTVPVNSPAFPYREMR